MYFDFRDFTRSLISKNLPAELANGECATGGGADLKKRVHRGYGNAAVCIRPVPACALDLNPEPTFVGVRGTYE